MPRKKKKQSSITTGSNKHEAVKPEAKTERTTSSPRADWKKVSVKHKKKFERLLKVWDTSPELITMVNDNGVCFEEEYMIGRGSYGTEVYICLGLDGIERAIKRLPKQLCKKFLKNERDILNSPNAVESPRIVNYCFYDDTSSRDFGFLILNLYEQNLEEFVRFEGKNITESCAREMIRQVLEGLRALHSREPRILHRDLKPTNILVDLRGNLLLSDFGIGRFFPEEGATTYNTSSESGSHGWVAYECIDWEKLFSNKMPSHLDEPIQLKWKEQSDIQVAGMLLFYILTKGEHPFGPPIKQMQCLYEDKKVGLADLKDPVVKDLLFQMLTQKMEERPYVEQALKHPYFLSLDEQMRFVEALGNESKMKNGNAVSKQLDSPKRSKPRCWLLPNNWKDEIGPDDLRMLCSGGKKTPTDYNGLRYTHCVRLIRNAIQHRGDKLRRLKNKKEGTSSIEEYFFHLFPHLPFVLYQIIRENPSWKRLPVLEELFPVINRRSVSESDAD